MLGLLRWWSSVSLLDIRLSVAEVLLGWVSSFSRLLAPLDFWASMGPLLQLQAMQLCEIAARQPVRCATEGRGGRRMYRTGD